MAGVVTHAHGAADDGGSGNLDAVLRDEVAAVHSVGDLRPMGIEVGLGVRVGQPDDRYDGDRGSSTHAQELQPAEQGVEQANSGDHPAKEAFSIHGRISSDQIGALVEAHREAGADGE